MVIVLCCDACLCGSRWGFLVLFCLYVFVNLIIIILLTSFNIRIFIFQSNWEWWYDIQWAVHYHQKSGAVVSFFLGRC